MEWIATSPHETVDILAQELQTLGISNFTKLYRGVRFACDLELAYEAHLSLRTASRIQVIISEFLIPDLDSLSRELQKVEWSKWLRSHNSFTIMPTLADKNAPSFSEEEIRKRVSESVVAYPFLKNPPRYKQDGENAITLVLFIRNGQCVLGIDTAGRALHKRGWRTNGHPAVLKETLAASILMLANYTGDEPLLDPMCGSGTFSIEGAYIALNKAPLIHRGKDDFALEHLAFFDRNLWRKVSDKLRAFKKSELKNPIYASDINSKYVEVAQKASLKARVEKYITFSQASFQELEVAREHGLIVMNLPYGERIGSGTIDKLYREVGEIIKKKYSNWRLAILVPSNAPIHLLAIKDAKSIDLFNGALPVKLLLKNP